MAPDEQEIKPTETGERPGGRLIPLYRFEGIIREQPLGEKEKLTDIIRGFEPLTCQGVLGYGDENIQIRIPPEAQVGDLVAIPTNFGVKWIIVESTVDKHPTVNKLPEERKHYLLKKFEGNLMGNWLAGDDAAKAKIQGRVDGRKPPQVFLIKPKRAWGSKPGWLNNVEVTEYSLEIAPAPASSALRRGIEEAAKKRRRLQGASGTA